MIAVDLLLHFLLSIFQHLFNFVCQCHVTLLPETQIPTIYYIHSAGLLL